MAVVTHSLTHSLTRRLLMLWRRSLPAFTLFWFVALSLSLLRCFVAFVAFVALLLFVCSFVRSFVVFVRCLGVVVESLLGGRWVVGPLLVGVAGCPGRGRGRGRRGCVRADGSIPSADFVVLGRVCSSRQFVAQASCSVWWYADRCSVCVSRRSSLRCGPGTGVVGMTDRAACFCPRRVLWTDQPTNYAN